ncbi:MAG TPA: hypothetical protein VLU94_02465 [Candidatus Nitrosotalea sp.]|nr:hypothetical protein [Candidatus Nitrosotalea sp.]
METAIQFTLPAPEVSLQGDLREWIDKYALVRLVLAAVQSPRLSAVDPVSDRGDSFRPHLLLSLLTYCYATGVYGSSDIQFRSSHDAMVRHLCAERYPEARLLRNFRRWHRQILKTCLTEVLYRAWLIRSGFQGAVGDAMADPGAHFHDHHVDPDGVFAAEAEERINTAVRMDCGAFDC